MNSNQVRDSSSANYVISRRECSKAQMCLQKILYIISTVPRHESCLLPQIRSPDCDRAFAVDLNRRVGLFGKEENTGESETNFLGKIVEIGGKRLFEDGNLFGSDSFAAESSKDEGEAALENSKIANSETEKKFIEGDDRNEQISNNGENEAAPFKELHYRSNDCLGLLIEAARLVSRNFGADEEEEESESETKSDSANRKRTRLSSELESTQKAEASQLALSKRRKIKEESADWMKVYENYGDTSPVVRSKRGRSQVLPCRYRDSVMEPWRRPVTQTERLSNKVSRKPRRRRF